MDRLVYTALTSLQRSTEAQSVTANNLANLATPGFRREVASLSAGWLASDDQDISSRVQSAGEAPINIFKPGRMEITGRPMDVAVDGDAWIQVEDENGQLALTRRGDFSVHADGRLVTGAGHQVMGDQGSIIIPSDISSLRVSREGKLEVLPKDETDWIEVGQLSLQAAPPKTISRGKDGLFRSTQATRDLSATVRVGAIEQSNMNASEALVDLVQNSRLYELQTKLISAAREMDEGTAALMRLS